MNKKKTYSLVVIGVMLLSLMAAYTATGVSIPCTVRGFVYIDGEMTTPEQIVLSFPEQNVTAVLPIDPVGYYVLDFSEKILATGTFIVTISSVDCIAEETITIIQGQTLYKMNLTVDTSLFIDYEPPSKVTGLTVTDAKNGKLDLTWDPATDNWDVDHYNIYRDDAFLTMVTDTSHQDINLTNGQEYTYEVSAVDTSDNEGEKSDPASGIPTATTAPPKPISAPNKKPHADASASDTFGFLGEEINFDGSLSTDKDGAIFDYKWNFGDGNFGSGETTTHIYEEIGIFEVTLTVEDDEEATDDDTISVEIITANLPPEIITTDGTTSGEINIDYTYMVDSTDFDTNDTIVYTFDWNDGTSNTSEVLPSNTSFEATHSWSSYGVYTVIITAEDSVGAQDIETITVYIDVLPIDDIIKGLLVDEDVDDPYDIFDNEDTDEITGVEKEEDTYLIDTDGDGDWDYTYDQEDGVLTYEDYVIQKYQEVFEEEQAAPGFELIVLLAAIAVAIIILRRRK
jgi:chitodextrinase